jgi:nucleoside-triphosphatase THEP1
MSLLLYPHCKRRICIQKFGDLELISMDITQAITNSVIRFLTVATVGEVTRNPVVKEVARNNLLQISLFPMDPNTS